MAKSNIFLICSECVSVPMVKLSGGNRRLHWSSLCSIISFTFTRLVLNCHCPKPRKKWIAAFNTARQWNIYPLVSPIILHACLMAWLWHQQSCRFDAHLQLLPLLSPPRTLRHSKKKWRVRFPTLLSLLCFLWSACLFFKGDSSQMEAKYKFIKRHIKGWWSGRIQILLDKMAFA